MSVRRLFIFAGFFLSVASSNEDLHVLDILSTMQAKLEEMSVNIAHVNSKVDSLTLDVNGLKSPSIVTDKHETRRLLMSDPTYIHGIEEKVQQLTANMADATAKQASQTVELNSLITFKAELDKRTQDLTTKVSNNTHELHNIRTSGATYVRWGRTDCPANISEIVYNGYVGSSSWNEKGGASNRLCMTSDPETAPVQTITQYATGPLLYGAEYYIPNENSVNHYDDVPCAVCKSHRSAVVMVPGRRNCYPGWTKEYSGYIVSGEVTHSVASQFLCLDDKPQAIPHSSDVSMASGAGYFEPAFTKCGSLACPPYVENKLVLCVVCSQ